MHRVWDKIKSPAPEQIVPYDRLPKVNDPKVLDKLAVLKVNGGLGTSMGMFYNQIGIPYIVSLQVPQV